MFLVDQLEKNILKWKRIDKLVNGVKIKLTKCKRGIANEKSIGLFFSIILGFVFLSACQNSVKQSSSGLKKIDFILDWTPNTNHTGLYVAKEKGYFKEAGLDVDIKLPPEDSSSDLIINGKAPFGIYFQDSMAKKLDKGAGLPLLQLSSNTIRQELFQEKMQRSQVKRFGW